MKRYHRDVWFGHDLGGYWYGSAGIGRNGQPISNLRYRVVTK